MNGGLALLDSNYPQAWNNTHNTSNLSLSFECAGETAVASKPDFNSGELKNVHARKSEVKRISSRERIVNQGKGTTFKNNFKQLIG